MRFALVVACFLVVLPTTETLHAAESAGLLSARDILAFNEPAPDHRIAYGEHELAFAELRLPAGAGPHPVVVFMHGGCWLSQFDLAHTRKLTGALAQAGYAVWSPEYRRVGDPESAWPATFNDIAASVDVLPTIARTHGLDLDAVVLMGHSAGGQLALWAAARENLPAPNPFGGARSSDVLGVIGLAPAPGLDDLHEREVCGHVIDKLMGGSPSEYPDRYRLADPIHTALSVPQILITGGQDAGWTPSGQRYFEIAKARGDDVEMIEIAEAGHFELIDPDSSSFPVVLEATRRLFAR